MLKDNDFLALIKLLDDEDPEVRHIAESRLYALGVEGIDRLESAADEIGEPESRKLLLELIDRMRLDQVAELLLNWRKGGGNDLLEGWIILTGLHKSVATDKKIQDEVSRLTHKIWLEINEKMYVYEKLRVFNHMFFVHEEFLLEKDKPEHPELCFPDTLINSKKGNSQTLCLLYLIIANRLELPVSGVILPGYSVLYCYDERQPFYIDVAGGGNFVTREGIELFIKKLNIPEHASYYKPTSNIFLLLNLLEVLRKSYYTAGKSDQAHQVEELLKKIEIRFE